MPTDLQTPRVLNLRHTGCKVPPGAVYIGRENRFPPFRRSKWHNPFRIGPDGTREQVIALYRDWLPRQPELMAALPELHGLDLACWCAPDACHGDILLELANGAGERRVVLLESEGVALR
jgi:hypothetical protein